MTSQPHTDSQLCVCVQIVEAMEIMLLAVVSPEIRCEWKLDDWQVALVSTVRAGGFLCTGV